MYRSMFYDVLTGYNTLLALFNIEMCIWVDNVHIFSSVDKGDKKKKKKVVKVKKNRINSEKMPGAYSQPVDLSATFGEPPVSPF